MLDQSLHGYMFVLAGVWTLPTTIECQQGRWRTSDATNRAAAER